MSNEPVADRARGSLCFSLQDSVGDFTGRVNEIQQLVERLGGTDGRTRKTLLYGMGGVGKTILAREAAQRVARQFPDGLIELNLRGMTEAPLTPAAAMESVIRELDPDARLPNPRNLARRFLTVLSDKRVLILLDNARDEEQVKDLISVRPPAVFLITSRTALQLDAVAAIRLGELMPEEAFGLLREILGAKGTDGELRALAEACGRLPLALRVAGDFLRVSENWSTSAYLGALKDETRRLKQLKGPTEEKDVPAVLGFSATELARSQPERAARWQLLSVFPATFDANAAATVWDMWSGDELDAALAESELTSMLHRSLVQFDGTGRYGLHDLMRLVARTGLAGKGNDVRRAGSAERVRAAELRFTEYFRRVLETVHGWYEMGHDHVAKALAVFDREMANIRHAMNWADANRKSDASGSEGCRAFYLVRDVICLRFSVDERIKWWEAAVEVCRSAGDRAGEARAWGYLGNAHHTRGAAHEAIGCYQQSLASARAIADEDEEGRALGNLGNAYLSLNEPNKAIEYFRQRLVIVRKSGYRAGEAKVYGCLGNAHLALQEYDKAIEYYQEDLSLTREFGFQIGQGKALGHLGRVFLAIGDVGEALAYCDQHLSIAREFKDRAGEAYSSWNKAHALMKLGQREAAIPLAQFAVAFYESIGHVRVEEYRQTLDAWLAADSQVKLAPGNPDATQNAIPGVSPTSNAPSQQGGITDEHICAWFDAINPNDRLKHLQVFWCLGKVESEAFLAAGRALGYGKLAQRLEGLNPYFHTYLPTSVGYIRKTCLPLLTTLFNTAPFQPDAWDEDESETALRVDDRQGKRRHGRWTPRARKAWHYIDRFLTLRQLLPRIDSRSKSAGTGGQTS
jgi:tetratricopeptide (TPR) repeat protein